MAETTVYPLLATIGDPDGTRTVTSIVALLVALGLALAMVAVWLYKTTRPDPELLAPLELMGERRWRRADPVAQRRTLDAARPDEADPLDPTIAPPKLDEAFDAGPSAPGFDDLSGDLDGDARAEFVPPPPGFMISMDQADDTPRHLEQQDFDSGFADDIDPEALAAAEAQLDAELAQRDDT